MPLNHVFEVNVIASSHNLTLITNQRLEVCAHMRNRTKQVLLDFFFLLSYTFNSKFLKVYLCNQRNNKTISRLVVKSQMKFNLKKKKEKVVELEERKCICTNFPLQWYNFSSFYVDVQVSSLNFPFIVYCSLVPFKQSIDSILSTVQIFEAVWTKDLRAIFSNTGKFSEQRPRRENWEKQLSEWKWTPSH